MRLYLSSGVTSTMMLPSFFVMAICAALLPVLSASPVTSTTKRATTERQAYIDPNTVGGSMLTISPGLDVGEPINAIVSGLSDESVLTVEGFLLWVTSIHFGVSCYGQADGGNQLANLGNGNETQGTDDGGNGVLRWNYYMPYMGTCIETFIGGNHFRWFRQQSTGAYFLAASVELDLSQAHMIATNGYNNGRDEMVGNATFTNGTEWEGNLYNTTVEWIEAGVLLNATSEGINHPSVALPGQPTQDGRVALLTVRQLKSAADAKSGAVASFVVPSSTFLAFTITALIATVIVVF